jgi:hypothetical protein
MRREPKLAVTLVFLALCIVLLALVWIGALTMGLNWGSFSAR